ncbi:MAG: TetR/AcrR family transcriptional regulator [Leadbetterella sp.]|nr:TetR/AcrR family transcriptional regulator [Leadbetterella sp.]
MKNQIINTASHLLIERGFNAFSFKTISEEVGIKTSSIHYHFPTKTDLGKAVIQLHRRELEEMIAKTEGKTPLEKLNKLFRYYKRLVTEGKVCIVGALTSDINTLEEPIRLELLSFGERIIGWVASVLKEGESDKTFKKNRPAKTESPADPGCLCGLGSNGTY